MSIQLSLYWRAVDQLEWYWAGDSDRYSGTLEDLSDQKQERNLDVCLTRLFLPPQWFSTVDVSLPAKSRRVSLTMLRFAAEEYLAQDIDTVHLVLKQKPVQGKATIEATDLNRLSLILGTLKSAQFQVIEAYNAQSFIVPDDQTDDLLLLVHNETVTVSARNTVFDVHAKGFAQWFELWAEQQQLPDDARIKLISESAEGSAKALATEFEATGYVVNWQVQPTRHLVDWHDQAEQRQPIGNLMTGPFSQNQGRPNYQQWLPALVASVAVIALWTTLTVFENQRTAEKIDQTWQASEDVFLQVFGQNKRIQRPLMVREMRTRVATAGSGASETDANALTILRDISNVPESFMLEDFRYNADRSEAFFTLAKPVGTDGDAYSQFEALKNTLAQQGYQVEYSANQESDRFRAQFKTVLGGDA
ncbi:type II secretion system protein GspL [Reinekea blandensis]|uniref:Type II secretion system protein L n=1 Tax=Reinekea blandensis MED297 TaxID=314283 RepID=A4BDW8_9GAMM|nr:type II secretion system protein GspL [Reinekea blandensis]EAR09727.1 hypothetical protein MED297_16249 [Reinekea blandensis MED297]